MVDFVMGRYLLAGTDKVTTGSLARLAEDSNMKIRRRVAENRRCPVEILTRLGRDPSKIVRSAVAHNKATPRELLVRLSEDESLDVRHDLASDANIPVEIIEKLCLDENPYVRRRAKKTLARKEKQGPVSKPPIICCDGRPILKKIKECASTLSWLSNFESIPMDQVPKQHEQAIKQLEGLGLVFKRNNKRLELRRQRLQKVLEHEAKELNLSMTPRSLLAAIFA